MSLPEKLAEKYLDGLDYNSAIFYAQLNFDFSPTPGALCLLSKCFVCSGEYLREYILFETKSSEILKNYAKISMYKKPLENIIYYHLISCEKLDKYTEGIECFKKYKALLQRPAKVDAKIYRILSSLFRRCGNATKAKKLIEKAHLKDPFNWTVIEAINKNGVKAKIENSAVMDWDAPKAESDYNEKENVEKWETFANKPPQKGRTEMRSDLNYISNITIKDHLTSVLQKIADANYWLSAFRAQAVYQNLAALSPAITWAHGAFARLYDALGRHSDAAAAFEAAERAAPHCFDLADLRSAALWQLRRPADLAALSQKLFGLAPGHAAPQFWVVEANRLSLAGSSEAALRCLEKAAALKSDYGYAFFLMGCEHLELQALEKARESFRKSLDLDPSSFRALNGLGRVEMAAGEAGKAKRYFKLALRVNGENAALVVQLAMAMSECKEKQKALRLLGRLEKNELAKFHIAKINYELGNFDKATKLLEELKNEYESEPMVAELLAKIHGQTKSDDSQLGDIEPSE